MEERFTLTQLENLDRDSVRIRCIDSTDFVLGSQTNFNGPVTIVNCPDVLKGNRPPAEERIVIRENLLSRSALTEIQGIATTQTGASALPDSITVLPPFADDRPTSNKSRYGLILLCVGLLAATVASAPTFLTVASTEDHPEEEPKASKCAPLPNNICIYSRFCWGGRPISAATERPLEVAATYLVVSQTYDDYCYEHSACLAAVQNFQLNGSAEAACNFLLGGDGNVYEDRGWGLVALPDALRICFMGDFVLDYPTYPQVEAGKALIQFARERNYLAENYVLLGWKVSVPLYKVIYKWPRFSNETLAMWD